MRVRPPFQEGRTTTIGVSARFGADRPREMRQPGGIRHDHRRQADHHASWRKTVDCRRMGLKVLFNPSSAPSRRWPGPLGRIVSPSETGPATERNHLRLRTRPRESVDAILREGSKRGTPGHPPPQFGSPRTCQGDSAFTGPLGLPAERTAEGRGDRRFQSDPENSS